MGHYQIIICIIAIFYVNNSVSQANSACLSPDRIEGTCLSIEECPPLLESLKNLQRTEEETKYLQQSQCGKVDETVYVCCHFDTKNRFLVSSPTTTTQTDLLPTTRQCGRSFQNRIIGGNITQIDEYPWMALIEYTKPGDRKGFHCGATLINNRYVLTAAHCCTGRNIPSNWRLTGIRLGEWDRSTDEDCEVDITGKKDCADPHLDIAVEQIISHPNYNPQASNNLYDIALIRLNRYVTFTDFISPVCLPTQTELRTKTFESTKMDVTGWGSTESGPSSALKLKAAVDVWNFDTCRRKYNTRNYFLQETQMCAGGQKGVDSCGGDSGGPLVGLERLDNRDVYVVAGVVSFGPKPCGQPGWPAVYTRVGPYVDWIINTIRA